MSEVLVFVLPGMMFLWVMFLGQGPLQEVLHEKETHILPRILASPVTITQLILAKMVRCFLLCGLVLLALALFAGALSVLVGLVCQTEKQVILVAIFSAMILSALGGCWWPIEIVPDAFKTVAACTPSYWGVHGLQSVLYFGKSWQVLARECPILLGFAVLCGLVAVVVSKVLSVGRLKVPRPGAAMPAGLG